MSERMSMGRDRIDYRDDPAFIDLAKRAAAARGEDGITLSEYVRLALVAALREDGFKKEVEEYLARRRAARFADTSLAGPEQPRRPRGRPRKTKEA